MGVGPDGRPRPMGGFNQPTQLFGAHGQPLGPIPPQASSPYSDYPMPSPTSSYSSFADDRSNPSDRKRPQQDPHPSILPPPIPGQPGYQRADSAPRRTAVEDDLRLPPVTPTSGAGAGSNYSPGSSTSSISNLQPPSQPGLPSMTRPLPRVQALVIGRIPCRLAASWRDGQIPKSTGVCSGA